MLPNERRAYTILLLIKLSPINYEKGFILRPKFYCQASRLLLCILPRRDNRLLYSQKFVLPSEHQVCLKHTQHVLPAREGLNFTLIFLIKSAGSECTLMGASSGYRKPKQGPSKQGSNENFQTKMLIHPDLMVV